MLLVRVIITILASIAAFALLQTEFSVMASELGESALDLGAFRALRGIAIGFIGGINAILVAIAAMGIGQAFTGGTTTKLTVQGFGAGAIVGIPIHESGGTQTSAAKLSGTDTEMGTAAI